MTLFIRIERGPCAGPIVRLQVQSSAIKVRGVREYYTPKAICSVETVFLTPRGGSSITQAGEHLLDVYQQDHPRSRYRRGNGISLCFTSHYHLLRARFGAHLHDGVAGENLLIATDQVITLEQVEKGLLIQTATGSLIPLSTLLIATPCEVFSRYALGNLGQ
jgi:hypothetical protein